MNISRIGKSCLFVEHLSRICTLLGKPTLREWPFSERSCTRIILNAYMNFLISNKQCYRFFYVLLTVRLSIVLVINQLNTQNLFL